jgi:hypothetical protein
MGETVAMQPMMSPSSAGPLPAAKPKGRALLVLGTVLLVGGIVMGITLAVTGVIDMGRAVDGYQRVPVPGGGSVELDETGTYTLYYEQPPSLVGTSYFSASELAVIDPRGAQLPIVVGNTSSSYDFGDHSGRSIGTFRADVAGTYRIRTVESDGEGSGFSFEPTGQIAVTQDTQLRSIGLILGGVFGGGAMVVTGIVLLIIGGVRRSRSKQAAYAVAAPGWGGPAAGGWAPPGPQPWTPPGGSSGPQPWAPPGGSPGPQPWTPPGGSPGPQPWTPPPSTDPPPPPGWVPPPAPPADRSGWPPPSDGPIS